MIQLGIVRIGNDKSASVYECFPFIWPYNGLSVEVAACYIVSGWSATRKPAFSASLKIASEKSPLRTLSGLDGAVRVRVRNVL